MNNFISKLANHLENLSSQNLENYINIDLSLENIVLFNTPIIVKYRDEILTERSKILKEFSQEIEENKDKIYIYGKNNGYYNIYKFCDNKTDKKLVDEFPSDTQIGNIFSKINNKYQLDKKSSEIINIKIKNMIKEKIIEQEKYLSKKRIENHIYEVSEKSDGRIWLYDTSDEESEGIEEINFPNELYETAEEGDLFIYINNNYEKYE